jgi:hypothetical protein
MTITDSIKINAPPEKIFNFLTSLKDAGILLIVRSGLPSLIVQPAMESILTEQGFTQINSDELTLYKGSVNTDSVESVYVMVRIQDSDMFIASSGQEIYTESLIKSVNLNNKK